MNQNNKAFLLLFIIIAGLFAFVYKDKIFNEFKLRDVDNTTFSTAIFNGDVMQLEIADTESERRVGLSNRNYLPDWHGMLFVFPEEGKHSFWMKDMRFPIDIIWFNEDFDIVFIEKNVDPSTFPNSFTPKEVSKYVLEVNANFSDNQGLKVGDKIIFE